MTGPELSRPVRADTIGEVGRAIDIVADAGERSALARRFALQSLERLEATAVLARSGAEIALTGTIDAELSQSCVATAEPVPARIRAPFAVRFRQPPEAGADEVELDEHEMDVMFIDGAMIDVGEAIAQTLALALDPYPRLAQADEALRHAGVRTESEAGPFGALAALRDKLTP